METIFHIVLLIGLGIAVIGIVGWAVFEIIDFLRWIFPRDGGSKK